MPKRRARPRPRALPPADPGRLAPWLLLALALPRIVRLLYPAVWVEDDLLLESSLAAARGLRPYVDFAHAQMPLLEWVGGAYIRLVGASHVRMELLNGLAIYVTSVLLFFVARRAAGARAATAASLLYACHSLVFRYHVWTREFFVSALVLGAILVVLGDTIPARGKVPGAASLLCAACAIKLTAAVAVVAVVGYVAAGMGLPRRAAALGGAFAAGFAAFVAFCSWRYGEAFVFQAFLFHFLKGRGGVEAGPFYIASLLDVLGPLALFGVIRLADRRRWNDALGLTTTVLAADLLFIAVLSPTAWGHNYLEAWPLVALVAGAGLEWLIDACRSARLAAAGAGIVAAVCLLSVTPLDNEASLRGSVYGFGFVPRAELARVAAGLAAASDPRSDVVAPSFIAFEANRLQAIRYPENIGVMTVGRERWRAEGFRAAREEFGSRSFFDLIDQTSHIWNDQFARAIAVGGPVNAVIPDSPVQLLPLVNATPDALTARGFHRSAQTAHFTLWVRPAAHVESRAVQIETVGDGSVRDRSGKYRINRSGPTT